MKQCGLCGTDISMLYKGLCGDLQISGTVGLGHEASGVVTKCGSAVKNFKPGELTGTGQGHLVKK